MKRFFDLPVALVASVLCFLCCPFWLSRWQSDSHLQSQSFTGVTGSVATIAFSKCPSFRSMRVDTPAVAMHLLCLILLEVLLKFRLAKTRISVVKARDGDAAGVPPVKWSMFWDNFIPRNGGSRDDSQTGK